MSFMVFRRWRKGWTSLALNQLREKTTMPPAPPLHIYENSEHIDKGNGNLLLSLGTCLVLAGCSWGLIKISKNPQLRKISINVRLGKMIKLNIKKTRKGPKCSICWAEIMDGESRFVTMCNHIFHHECINKWFARKRTCPNCRAWT